MRKFHLMKNPKTGEVKRVALNAWAGARRQGFEFVTPEDEAKMNIEASEKASKKKSKKTADKK